MSNYITPSNLHFRVWSGLADESFSGVTGTNGLFRTNWFNGRFLTAEALRTQDDYWEQRTQLLAQVYSPGIAWGLGVVGSTVSQCIEMQPGLAFNGIGQPILVSQSHSFKVQQLLDSA